MLSQTKLVSCALAVMLASYGIAQERAGQGKAGQPDQNRAGQDTQDRAGQARPGQAGQDRPGQIRPGQDRAGQAGRETEISRTGVSNPMDAHFAACLLLGNQAEIALGRFAMQNAKNEKVKQFAQEMVAAHSKDASELQRWVGNGISFNLDEGAYETSAPGAADRTRGQDATDRATTPRDSASQGADRARAGEQVRSTDTPQAQPGARPGAGQTAQPGQQNRPGQPGQPGQLSQPGQAGQQTFTSVDASSHAAMATQRLNIEKQVAQKCLAMIKSELQQKPEKFDQGYMGQQIGAHIHMISQLEVYQQHASPELKQVIQKSLTAAQDHLRQAKELCEELDSHSASAGATGRNPATRTNPATRDASPATKSGTDN